jgi:acyl-CoA synthetase (NDP forming)
MDSGIERLLQPESVAIVGTSPKGGRGTRVHANILKADFGGRVYAVNPKYQEILGTLCFGSLGAVPEVPDCVVLAVPADATLALAQECADLGVGGIVALASGFAEAGPRGLERQERLRNIADSAGLAVCGPNGIGLWSVGARFAAFSPPLPGIPRLGEVALISQSGGLLLEVLNPLLERGVGFSHILSTGNEAATTLEDYLGYLIEQPAVRLLVAIVESFKRPGQLGGVLRRAAELEKPLIVLKVGLSEAGSRAAASHTGALAQDDDVVDTFLKAGGAVRVRNTEHLVETAVLFRRQCWPRCSSVALVSTSGGRCSLLGDLASSVPLDLATFQPETVGKLKDLLPEFGTPNNPLDPTGVVFDREGIYTPVLAALADDPGVGLVGVYQVTRSINARDGQPAQQRTHRSVGLAAEVVQAAQGSETPIVAFSSTTGGVVDPQVVEVLERGGVPLLLGLESALAAIGAAVEYARFAERSPRQQSVNWWRPNDISKLREMLARDGSLNEFQSKKLLESYGMQQVGSALAHSIEEAIELAEAIGYPVVMKASAIGLDHKSENGLVRLDIRGPDQLRDAFGVLRAAGDAVLVERMLPPGVELILGARRTPFGPVVVCGAGGILAELVRDTQVRPAPVDEETATAMLSATRAGQLLLGYRGQPRRDRQAAAWALVRLSQLMCDLQDLVEEIDLNPLSVQEHGAFVLDALVVGRSKTSRNDV